MLLTALLLTMQALPADACAINPVGWTCKATWIASLPPRQQRAVLILLKGGMNLDVKNRLMPNMASKEDACWVTKVHGMGNAMLSMAATKNDDLRSYFIDSSEITRGVVEGRLKGKEAQTLNAARPFPGAFDAQTKADGAEVERLYGTQIKASENALIAFAKVAASRLPECKSAR